MFHKEHAYFATGNAVFGDRIPVLVLIPKSQLNWVYLSFFGALEYMTEISTWITGGETDTDEAVTIFKRIYDEARAVLFYIGMVSDFAAPLPDDSGWLQCDGTPYNITDFPDLYAVIGTAYNTGGEPSGTFRVPDTTGRVRATINGSPPRLPGWADSAGGTGGESEHTLDVSEMPSHTHTDTGHIHTYTSAGANATTIGPGAPQPTAVPVPATPTSSGNAALTNTGGDGAHNNVQPTIVLFTYILAKF
jgi:microcystin-dependent protein